MSGQTDQLQLDTIGGPPETVGEAVSSDVDYLVIATTRQYYHLPAADSTTADPVPECPSTTHDGTGWSSKDPDVVWSDAEICPKCRQVRESGAPRTAAPEGAGKSPLDVLRSNGFEAEAQAVAQGDDGEAEPIDE